MSRRPLTLLLSGVLAVGLTVGAAAVPVPYVSYLPGPTYDTLGAVGQTPVIAVEGRQTFPTEGHLELTTIRVRPRLTLVQALLDWGDRDHAVVPREFVYPPGDSTEEVQRRNEERKVESENAATLAALNHLDLPYTTSVRVQRVEPGLPADGALQRDDQITAVDGKPVSTSQGLRDAISPRPPGSQVTLSLVRGGQAREAVLTTARPESGEERSIVGVIAAEIPDYGFEISITLQNVGGPSAGLMFALGIIDKLGPESVTGGRFVAGTGEIRSDGTVGPIGGIQQKLVAARARGADVFLVPDANCPEARERAPDGLRLVRVATLDEAVERLRALDEGGDPPTC